MRNHIYLLAILFLSISCTGQQTISLTNYDGFKDLKNNNYIKDIDSILNPFVGIWEWNNGSNTIFRIKFVKVLHNKTSVLDKHFEDQILGGYQYIVNGVEVVNTLNFTTSFSDTNYINFATLLTTIDRPLFKNLHIIVEDKIKGKTCGADFKIQNLSSLPLTAHWKLYNIETYRGEDLPPKPLSFSIPSDVILTKLP